MIRKKFDASVVFANDDKFATVYQYPKSPVTSAGRQILKYVEHLKTNTAVFRNCFFLVDQKNNQKHMANANGKHIVEQESDLYVVTVFPSGSTCKTGTGFSVITTLPKGLVMHGKDIPSDGKVYCFEGLNLALFDQAPSLN